MTKRLLFLSCFMVLAAIAYGQATKTTRPDPSQPAAATPAKPKAKPSVFEEFAHAFSAAFNRHDAHAAAELWSENGAHVDRVSGKRSQGRAAIEKVYTDLFKQHEPGELTLAITDVRQVKPDVAKATGTVTILHPSGEATESLITALLVKENDKWLLDSVEESAVPAPITPYDHLQSLGWLEGSWHDQTDGVDVHTTTRWSANRTFLSRHYSVTEGGTLTHQGLQIIGWDPEKRQIRSWNFESDGSFGEGTWTNDGNDWTVKIHSVLPDARHATATQHIHKLDDNSYTTQLIGRDTDGEILPSGKLITVTRE